LDGFAARFSLIFRPAPLAGQHVQWPDAPTGLSSSPFGRPIQVIVFARYRVLFGVSGFSRLLISSVLGRLPMGMFSLAILLFVRQQTGSFLVAGVTVGAFTFSGAIISPIHGARVDRIGQWRVLLPCAAVQGLLLVALIIIVRAHLPAVSIVAMAALAGSALPPISGCIRALWSEVASDPETLEAAYALDAITQEVIYTAGPLLVGFVAVFVAPTASMIMCAGITVLGTGLFATSQLSRRWVGASTGRVRQRGLLSEGFRTLLGSALLGGMVVGALEVGLPATAVHLGSTASAGVFVALLSVGSMVGGVVYSARTWRWPVGQRYTVILLGLATCVVPLVAVSSVAGGVLFSLVSGLGVAPMLSSQFSLVGALTPAGAATEAFAWHLAATVGGIAAGTALGGVIIQATGAKGAFVLACVAAASAAVVAHFGDRRLGAVATTATG
jgi:MFS family permease